MEAVMMRMGDWVCCGTETPYGLDEAGPTKALGCTVQHLHLTPNIIPILSTRFSWCWNGKGLRLDATLMWKCQRLISTSLVIRKFFSAEKLLDVEQLPTRWYVKMTARTRHSVLTLADTRECRAYLYSVFCFHEILLSGHRAFYRKGKGTISIFVESDFPNVKRVDLLHVFCNCQDH
jgi:hypothetical protein